MIHKRQFEAIGTAWYIEFECPDTTDVEALWVAVLDRIAVFDLHYSRFRDDSLVAEIARKLGVYQMPPDMLPMLTLYKDLGELTEGAFTPLIGNTMVEAGYDAEYSLRPKQLHTPPSFEETITITPPTLTIRTPVVLDFGAAGKGYLIDLVAGILREFAVTSYIVDAGGDIALYSKDGTVRDIGLENPGDTSQAIGIAHIATGSICGSAGNRRAWDKYTHIINPHTLESPRDILATWVTAETTMLADAISTCLFFTPGKKLQAHYPFEYLILRSDYSIEMSDGFPAELFTTP